MGKWKVPSKGYDFDDENMIKNSLLLAIQDYLKDLDQENSTLKEEFSEIDEFRDSFFLTQYKIEKDILIRKHLVMNKKMATFILEKQENISQIFSELNKIDDNSARLIEHYFYITALGRRLEKFIRILAYTKASKDGYLALYKDLYHEIKREVEDYYVNDKSRVIKWTFYDNENFKGSGAIFYSTKYDFQMIKVQGKPLRRAASILTEIITGEKPDIKDKFSENIMNPFL